MISQSENNEINNYIVGNVISVDGLKITILMLQNTNMLSYFYNGVYYRGINIGEYTINTLDSLSKERIPHLAPGQCILTGTLFDLPLAIQVNKLDEDKAPNSNNADVINLWKRTER